MQGDTVARLALNIFTWGAMSMALLFRTTQSMPALVKKIARTLKNEPQKVKGVKYTDDLLARQYPYKCNKCTLF